MSDTLASAAKRAAKERECDANVAYGLFKKFFTPKGINGYECKQMCLMFYRMGQEDRAYEQIHMHNLLMEEDEGDDED